MTERLLFLGCHQMTIIVEGVSCLISTHQLISPVDTCANVFRIRGKSRAEESSMKKLFVLCLLTALVTAAHAGDDRQPVFIRARCEGLKSSIALSWLTKSVADSPKYRLVSSLDDNGHFGVVVRTVYMSCVENNEVTAIATSYGIAKCSSHTKCGSVLDGESINAALCNANVTPDCGRALFKAFETYMSIPNRPLQMQELH